MGREVFTEVPLQRRDSTMWLHTLGVFAHCTLGYARFSFTLEGGQNWVMGLKSLSAHSKVDGEASLNGNSTFFRSSKGQTGSGFLKPTTQGR